LESKNNVAFSAFLLHPSSTTKQKNISKKLAREKQPGIGGKKRNRYTIELLTIKEAIVLPKNISDCWPI
jgi:hypothetical protein